MMTPTGCQITESPEDDQMRCARRDGADPRPAAVVALIAATLLAHGAGLGNGIASAQQLQREAHGPVLAAILGPGGPGVIRESFRLPVGGEVRIEAEGLACNRGQVFLASAWILDADTREPVWTMQGAPGSWNSRTENWEARADITLPEGTYTACFAGYGGRLPIERHIKVFGIPIGRLQSSFGVDRAWGEAGDPKRWGIRVQAMDAGLRALPVPDPLPGPFPDADVRLLGLGTLQARRARIELGRSVEFRLRFTGEYGQKGRFFADNAWLVDAETWTRIWEPELDTTIPAGGADKNRRFSGTVLLQTGSYVLTAMTDDSHDASGWNMLPPFDPESWGVCMTVVDRADREAVSVCYDTGLPEPAISILRQGNDAFSRELFSLTGRAQILVRSLGESVRGRRLTDYAWIENLRTLETVWMMDVADTYPSGGDTKNRLIEQVLGMPPGDYALCYITDDSHAFQSWNRPPPWEPENWGVTLAPLDTESMRVFRTGDAAGMPAVLALAPVRNRQDMSRRFGVQTPTRFRLVAMGEGTSGEMHDYGWIENEDDGRTVWEMEYANTQSAGGARKNRIIRDVIELPRGSYVMRYVSDGSHAFGSWNQSPPPQPHLWGLTLVELR